jgi:hypothetical protein
MKYLFAAGLVGWMAWSVFSCGRDDFRPRGSSSETSVAGNTGDGFAGASAGGSTGGAAAEGEPAGGSATGGQVGQGGQASQGGASCKNVTPCGGDLVGTWSVTSSCLQVSGELDLMAAGMDCPSAPLTGSLLVTGTWIAQSNGVYRDATSTSGQEQFTLAPECLLMSGTTITCDRISPVFGALGYSSVTCTSTSAGGCNCTASIDQVGGVGVVSFWPPFSGTYAIAGDVVTIDDESEYSYCVSGDMLRLTPLRTDTVTVSGAVVLQRN